MKVFRCKNCGFLEGSAYAGEEPLPYGCRVCSSGMAYHPRLGTKTVDKDNWEILADATIERLAELGLKPEHVEKHVPLPKGETTREPKHVKVNVVEGTSVGDKMS